MKHFRHVALFVTLLLVVGLVAAIFTPGSGVLAQDEPAAPFTWELTTPAHADALKGSSSLPDLQSTLFDSGTSFLDGAAELVLTLPPGSSALTLNLEARITTGYRWELQSDASSAFTQVAESTFVMRYTGYGAPAIQTLQLQDIDRSGGTVRLRYVRPFGTPETPLSRLSVAFSTPLTGFDLIDPTPKAPVKVAPDQPAEDINAQLPDLVELPASWDWRTKGIVPPVRNQLTCGSCWAFGTTGIMESALKKAGGPLIDLSEQFLVSCNKEGWDCGGGRTAHDYHFNTLGLNQSVVGAVLESAKPYTNSDSTCNISYNHPYKLADWEFVTTSEWNMPTITQIKTAIYTYGPVTAGICAGTGFNNYTGGVFAGNDEICGGYTNHQIILVGWNDATQSWILRNSWGSGWGENGYMRIKYHTPSTKHSRVGQGTSWVKVASLLVPVPQMPDGTVNDQTPTFKWSKVTNATQYQFRVYQGTSTTPLYTVNAASSTCASTSCSKTPATSLAVAAYKWQVRAYIGGAWKTWSAKKSFDVANATPAFNSQFNGSMTGWEKMGVLPWFVSSTAMYTEGDDWNYANVYWSKKQFANFDYSARIKRTNASNEPTSLMIRMGTSLKPPYDWWSPGYEFGIYSNGQYYIDTINPDASIYYLQPPTASSAIVQGDWNILRVVAVGSKMKFYINGTLVKSVSDTDYTTGYVGISMYNSPYYDTRVDVDWAKLTVLSASYRDDDVVSPGQQALNDAAVQAAMFNPPELPSSR